MIPEDTAATWRRPKLAEVGPTSAPNENLKLKEVEQTAAPTLGAAYAWVSIPTIPVILLFVVWSWWVVTGRVR